MCQITPYIASCCGSMYVKVEKTPSCPDDWPNRKCPQDLCLQVYAFKYQVPTQVIVCWRCKADAMRKSSFTREAMRPCIDRAEVVVGLEEIDVREKKIRAEQFGKCWHCGAKKGCESCKAAEDEYTYAKLEHAERQSEVRSLKRRRVEQSVGCKTKGKMVDRNFAHDRQQTPPILDSRGDLEWTDNFSFPQDIAAGRSVFDLDDTYASPGHLQDVTFDSPTFKFDWQYDPSGQSTSGAMNASEAADNSEFSRLVAAEHFSPRDHKQFQDFQSAQPSGSSQFQASEYPSPPAQGAGQYQLEGQGQAGNSQMVNFGSHFNTQYSPEYWNGGQSMQMLDGRQGMEMFDRTSTAYDAHQGSLGEANSSFYPRIWEEPRSDGPSTAPYHGPN